MTYDSNLVRVRNPSMNAHIQLVTNKTRKIPTEVGLIGERNCHRQTFRRVCKGNNAHFSIILFGLFFCIT